MPVTAVVCSFQFQSTHLEHYMSGYIMNHTQKSATWESGCLDHFEIWTCSCLLYISISLSRKHKEGTIQENAISLS